jgi:hypothetical protein
MDEVRLKEGKRFFERPQRWFSATMNEYGEQFDEDIIRRDYYIRGERDIDDEGIFMRQRVLQPMNMNSNMV